jgi:hypothetical protein
MQVHPLVPDWITFIWPSGRMFRMVAPFNTAAGAASFNLLMSSWSVTAVGSAAATGMAATKEKTAAPEAQTVLGY